MEFDKFPSGGIMSFLILTLAVFIMGGGGGESMAFCYCPPLPTNTTAVFLRCVELISSGRIELRHFGYKLIRHQKTLSLFISV